MTVRKITTAQIVLFLPLILGGCAVEPLYLVNAFGDRERCLPEKRSSLIGAVLPAKTPRSCVSALAGAGYLPEKDAGFIAMPLAMEDGRIIATRLPEEALKQQPDLEAGDRLIAVDHQTVSSLDAARSLLFGKAGSRVSLTFDHNGDSLSVQLTRRPNTTTSPITQPETIPLTGDSNATDTTNDTNAPRLREHRQNDTYTAAEPPGGTPSLLERIRRFFSKNSEQKNASEGSGLTRSSASHHAKMPEPDTATTPPPTTTHDPYTETTPMGESPEKLVVPQGDNPYTLANILRKSPPPPLIIAGDQVCRKRRKFIDIGFVEKIRKPKILVTIDHIQLARPPYTEFHHFDHETAWSAFKMWRPCSGDPPYFLK